MFMCISKLWYNIENPIPSNDAYLLQQSSKFHADPIWNDRPLGFLKKVASTRRKTRSRVLNTDEFSLSISFCMTNEVNINEPNNLCINSTRVARSLYRDVSCWVSSRKENSLSPSVRSLPHSFYFSLLLRTFSPYLFASSPFPHLFFLFPTFPRIWTQNAQWQDLWGIQRKNILI